MRNLTILMILSSCTNNLSDNPISSLLEIRTKCNRPAISLYKDQVWLKEDEDMLNFFERGCIKRYTDNHCPSKVLKTERLSYQVICKKVK